MVPSAKNKSLEGLRILVLFPHMTLPGGALTYTLELVRQLLDEGATIAVLTLRADVEKYSFPQGVQLIDMSGPVTSSLRYWLLFPLWQRRLNDKIKNWQPDVIVPQVFPSNWWGFIYKRLHPSTKLVWICHEPSAFIHSAEWIGGLKPSWKRALAHAMKHVLAPLDVFLCRYSDAIVANSNFTANLVFETYNRHVDAVAYPGIDLQFFSGVSVDKQPSLITVAHLTRYKRVDFLLRVFAMIKEEYPDLTYHIVGDGDDIGNLKILASDLGIGSSVIFHGRLSHGKVAELNSGSLLFMHGSINETFGMAPLEAIACGTPVLAHRSGGPREFITEDCGRLVDSLDADVWAQETSKCLKIFYEDMDCCYDIRKGARDFGWSLTLRPAVDTISMTAGTGK